VSGERGVSLPPERRSRRVRGAAALVDEATSSLQNYIVLFAALHYLSIADVGRFTLAYTTVTLLEIVLKALVLTSLNVHFAAADATTQRRAGAGAAAAAVFAGVAGGTVVALVGLGTDQRALFLAAGVAALALVAQESWRTYFFTVATPWRAVANDAACLVVTIVLVWLAAGRGSAHTPADLLLLLAGGTGAGFLVGIAQTRIVPSLPGGVRWLREHWPVGIRVAGSRGAAQLAGRLSLTVVGAEAGAGGLGRLGAARTLIAPATTLVTAMQSYSLPEAVRLHKRNEPRLLRRFLIGNSIGLAVLVLLTGLVLAVLPGRVGHLLAGDNFAVAKHLLLPVVLYSTGNALQQGARIGMLTLLRPGLAFRIAISTGVGIVAAAAVGAALAGASGAAWGLALVQGIQIVTWWSAFARVASGRPDRALFRRSRTVRAG
jgi:O-antigen/teichoic acid export membrane protein